MKEVANQYPHGPWLNPKVIIRTDIPLTTNSRARRFRGGTLELRACKIQPSKWMLNYTVFAANGKRTHHALTVGTILQFPTREAADKAADVFRRRIRDGNVLELRSAPKYRVHGKAFYTKEQYQQKLLAQDGKCLICGDEPPRLHFDHDHANGALRDLLCSHCNRAIGMLRDNPSFCESAANYLRKHGR